MAKQISLFNKDKRILVQEMIKAKQEANNNEYVEKDKITLEEWLKKWIRIHKRPFVKPRTLQGYIKKIKKNIIPYLENYSMQYLDRLILQEYFSDLTTGNEKKGIKKYSSKTIKEIKSILNMAFSDAEIDKIIKFNPIPTIRTPKVQREKKKPIISPTEQQQLIEILLSEANGLCYIFIMNTGVRPGENYGMKWKHYSYEDANIKVRDKEGKVYIENPRKYLMKTLNVSINTVTKIHKELNKVGLIKDVWDEVGKPNIVYIKYCETPKPQVIHKNYETPKIEVKKEEIKPVETEREVEEKKETIVPEVKEELVGNITDKDLEDAKRVMDRYKVGMIDFEANKVFKNIKFYLYRSKEEEIIKIAIRILVKKKREEGRIEVIKNIGTFEASYALERCKNVIRNNEYVIEKLIRYIELKIEHENNWNYHYCKDSQKL